MGADWEISVNIVEKGLTPAAHSCQLSNRQSRLPEKCDPYPKAAVAPERTAAGLIGYPLLHPAISPTLDNHQSR